MQTVYRNNPGVALAFLRILLRPGFLISLEKAKPSDIHDKGETTAIAGLSLQGPGTAWARLRRAVSHPRRYKFAA
jgi:hypothetical protein